MKIISLSLNRPVTVAMVFLLIIITGIISFIRLPITFLPELGYPRLTIITNFANSSPEEVENLISIPIEESVSTLKSIISVTSISREDVSIVTLKYNWGTDMAYASLDLREKLDNIRYLLPDDAERPNIAKLDPNEEPIMYISLTSKQSDQISQIQKLAENLVKRRLQQLEGVASADIIGNLEEEIQIWLDEDKLGSLGLNLEVIKDRIISSNFNIPGGTIREGHYKFNLNITGEFQNLQDIRNTPIIFSQMGNVITLSDIAEVKGGYKQENNINRLNGKRTIGVLIRKEADSNTVSVCNTVKKNLNRLQQEYPFVDFAIPVDQSLFIKESILSVLEAILIGGFLAFIVLFFFLNDLKSPFHIALAIPIAILTSFILMYFSKISLNIISLSGLALGVGMLVDNSIVVSESVFRRKKEGKSWFDAALEGTKEVGLAITASTLTTLAVFLPILYVKGIAASLFKQQALTVTYSLLASLLVSVTLLPLLASLRKVKTVRKKKPGKLFPVILNYLGYPFRIIGMIAVKIVGKIFYYPVKFLLIGQNKFEEFLQSVSKLHIRMLRNAIEQRKKYLIVFITIFLLTVLVIVFIDREFFPEFDQNSFTILLKLEPGTPLSRSDQMVTKVEKLLAEDKRIKSYFTSVGKSTDDLLSYYLEKSSSENLAEIKVNIFSRYSSNKVVSDYRQNLKKIPAVITFKQSDNFLVSILEFEEPGLSVSIFGEDLTEMRTVATRIKQALEAEQRFYNLKTDFELEKPQVRLWLDREAMTLYEISAKTVSDYIEAYITGDQVSDFHRFDDKIDISLYSGDKVDLNSLLDHQINTGNRAVPLRVLVNADLSRTLEEIRRIDQMRVFTLSFRYRGRLSVAINKLANIVEQLDKRSSGFPVKIGGINKEISGSLKSLIMALFFAVILVYMILASQFESLKLPLIIMFVAPMGVIGVTLALLITGTSVSVMSTLGMIILSGIIVNDAILLVDYAKHLRAKGFSAKEAITKAASVRLRPILMTTFTTVLGLLPLAIGIGSGSELQSAMAISVIGGIIVATMLTLIFIPLLYVIVEREN